MPIIPAPLSSADNTTVVNPVYPHPNNLVYPPSPNKVMRPLTFLRLAYAKNKWAILLITLAITSILVVGSVFAYRHIVGHTKTGNSSQGTSATGSKYATQNSAPGANSNNKSTSSNSSTDKKSSSKPGNNTSGTPSITASGGSSNNETAGSTSPGGSSGGLGVANIPLLGFFPGNQEHPDWMPDQLAFGVKVPLGEIFLDGSGWGTAGWGMVSSLYTYATGVGGSGIPWNNYRMIVSVPMLVGSGGATTLSQCAAGGYNTYFQSLAEEMIDLGMKKPIVRLGWEFNAGWYNWAANGDLTHWIQCFRQEANTLKSTYSQISIDWNPTHGYQQAPTDQYYPGDQYVDIMGMDIYDQAWLSDAYSGNDGNHQSAWNNLVNGDYGLQWEVNFAAQHNKPLSLPEWGLASRSDGHGGGDDTYFIQQVYNWVTSHNYYYVSYFNENASDGDHYLSDFPSSYSLYKQLFTPLAKSAPNN